MDGSVRGRIARLLSSRERHGEYLAAFVLATVCISLSVALGLRGRGIAATHTEQVLDCHYAGSGAHAHDASCYDAAGNLVCPLTEREYHVHDDGCYTETRELSCGMEEHTHTDACYDEEGALVCGLEEHAHTDACYQVARELTCGKEETSETHTHGPGCFREVTVEDGESEVEVAAAAANVQSSLELEETLKEKDENGVEHVVLTVGVKAPDGALPEGTALKLEKVEIEDVEDKVASAVEKDERIAEITRWISAVDVKLFDADGNEVQPTEKIELKITQEGIRTAENALLVRLLDDEAKAKLGKVDDAEVLSETKLVNKSDEDETIGNEDTLKTETNLVTTFVVVDYDEAGDAEADVQNDATVPEDSADDGSAGEESATTPDVFTGEAGNVKVTAEAPAGAFDGDVEMTVTSVDVDALREQVEAAVTQDDKQVTDLAAVDISFTDAEGNVVEPSEPVSVSLTSDVVLNAEEPALVQVADEASVMEDAEVINGHNENFVGAEDTFKFEADGPAGTYVLVGLETITTRVITASGEAYRISVTYGPEAEIPSGAELTAREIVAGTDEYESYYSQAADALGEGEEAAEIGFARFFDVSIMVGGVEVEPQAPVEVEIAYEEMLGLSDDEQMTVVHFADEGTEVIDAILGANGDGSSVSFTQSGFSVTGTVAKTLSDGDNLNFLQNGEEYILVVRTGNSGYYAVDQNGNLTPVTYDANENRVTFGDSFTEIHDADSYVWQIFSKNNNNRFSNMQGQFLTLQNGTAISGATGANLSCYNGYLAIGSTTKRWYLSLNLSNNTIQSKNAWYSNGQYTYNENPATVSFVPVYTLKDDQGNSWYGKDFDKQALAEWYAALQDRTPPLDALDKTAAVHDYANRIYKVDLTASSGIQTYANDIDLAFMLDFSNSMLFAASLTPENKKSVLTQNALNNMYGKNDSGPHIIVADKNGTATQYVVYRYDYETDTTIDKNLNVSGNTLQSLDGKWVVWDLSFYAKTQAHVCGYNSISSSPKWRQPSPLPDYDASNFAVDRVDGSGYQYAFYQPNEDYFESMTSGASIYSTDGNNGHNRLYYLKQGVKQSIQDIIDIAMKDHGIDLESKTVRVAYNLFWSQVGQTQPFMQMTDSTGTVNNYNDLVDKLTQGNTDGGTRQDLAMADTDINWGDSATKYAILITDGAPLQSGISTETLDQYLVDAAAALKEKGVTLITVGVALDEVWNGQYILHTIASTDKDGNPYYYHCERAEDLEYVLYDILREMMGKATVNATVSDAIDEAFYPVDQNGVALDVNDVIDLQGNRLGHVDGSTIKDTSGNKIGTVSTDSNGVKYCLTPDGKTLEAGIVSYDTTNKVWKVEWNNQGVPWEGWNSSIYVKTKEDFLGGNTISTNDGATAVSNSYTVEGRDPNGEIITNNVPLNETELTKRTQQFDTPHVNVDELALTQNSSEWTVYLGTYVNPGDQITKLLNQIKVREDVTKSDDDWRIADDGAKNPSKNEDSEELTLASVLSGHTSEGALTSDEINSLLSGTSVTRTYTEYGHQTGTITLALTKAGQTANVENHATTTTGQGVETYTLTVTFAPSDPDTTKSYHTTTGGSAGDPTGNMTSTNVHVINVFKKGLTITKVSEGGSEITDSTATFDLYREANTTYDTGAVAGTALNIAGMPTDKSYVKVAGGLTTGVGGSASATVDTLSALLNNSGAAITTPYYLVETSAPDGYIPAAAAIPLSLKFADDTTAYLVANDVSTPLITWTQASGLVVTPTDSGVKTYVVGSTTDTWTPNSNNETEDYKAYGIINTSGAELPAAGGSGLLPVYLLGATLMAVAGMVLARRRVS